MEKIFCPRCGNKLNSDAKFCERCGEKTYRNNPYQYTNNDTSNGLAIAGFITSLVFFLSSGFLKLITIGLYSFVGVLIDIIPIVLSWIGLHQINKSGEQGKTYAIIGLVFSIINEVLNIVLVAIFLLAIIFSA